MKATYDIARELAFIGAFRNIDTARTAVDALITENRIPVSDDGYVSDNNGADIMAALKG